MIAKFRFNSVLNVLSMDKKNAADQFFLTGYVFVFCKFVL